MNLGDCHQALRLHRQDHRHHGGHGRPGRRDGVRAGRLQRQRGHARSQPRSRAAPAGADGPRSRQPRRAGRRQRARAGQHEAGGGHRAGAVRPSGRPDQRGGWQPPERDHQAGNELLRHAARGHALGDRPQPGRHDHPQPGVREGHGGPWRGQHPERLVDERVQAADPRARLLGGEGGGQQLHAVAGRAHGEGVFPRRSASTPSRRASS